jgi:hypothetical protein
LTAQWPRKAKRMSAAIAGTASQRALLWTAARRRFGRELKDIVQASFRDVGAADNSR